MSALADWLAGGAGCGVSCAYLNSLCARDVVWCGRTRQCRQHDARKVYTQSYGVAHRQGWT